jgi:DNA mismatch repair protein MutL
MSNIRILPEILSNQIAAGEVVQRPSSVVKELAENCIDAKATRITVEIQGGGKSLIRVSDDGSGLGRDEAMLAIERYATSKIFTKEDLFAIASFGFRGEALPSIASVSKFCLVSRTAASDIGTRIEIAGGKLVKVSDEGAPVGTLVEVKHLFFNTPARRKFLKGDATEAGHIADTVSGLALGNPHIGFRLFVNKKLVKNFPHGQDLFQRSLLVLGRDVTHKLYRLKGLEGEISVSGVCSNPLVTRSTSGRIYLFVNNRLVYDRGLVAAVFKGYQGRIMKGRFPMGVVCVGLPFDQVDVNVHPTKREIKFLSPQPVYRAVGQAVETALVEAQKDLIAYAKSAKTGDSLVHTSTPYQNLGQSPEQNRDLSIPGREAKVARPCEFSHEGFGDRPAGRVAQSTLNWGQPFLGEAKKTMPGIKNVLPGSAYPTQSLAPAGPDEKSRINQSHHQLHTRFHVLGQVLGTYIVAQKENSLVLVDQHAAHERVVYEALKKRHHTLGVQSQDLLVPEVLDLTHGEADCLTAILDVLSGMGLRIEPFGGTTFVVKAVPVLLGEKELKPLVLELIETSQEDNSLIEIQDACLVSMACHSALRAHKQLNHQEMARLLEDLERCDNPLHCPHGRPTIVSFDGLQLKKLFKRLV